MTTSKIFFYFCVSFIVGILLNSFFQESLWWFLILDIIFISVFWKHKKIVIVCSCVLFFLFGVWRYQSFELKVDNNQLIKYIDQEVSFIGIVSERPEPGHSTTKIEIKIEDLNSKVLLTTWKYPEYYYGDKLKIKGRLEEPAFFDDFDYKAYLSKDGIYAVMYQPQIELIEKNCGNFIKDKLIFFKEKLKNSVNLIMSAPQSGLLEALFFGDEENISKEWIDKFNMTGTRHITAVSGMNITIISILVLNLFLLLGFWRKQAFYFSVIFIIFYVSIIGAPASGVRAGIMGILLLMAQYFGRYSDGVRIVVFSAFLMLLFNPLLLILDVGFQLSFLAILGLIYLQPIFSDWLKGVSNILEVRYTLSATLAAQCFTLPILIYNFGRVSLISPLVNLLIVPLITMVTILGFILAFIGLISTPLGIVFSFPIWLILTFILKIIDIFSKVSSANIVLEDVSFVWVIISYIFLGLFVWRIEEKRKLKRF